MRLIHSAERYGSWLRQYATRRKVANSNPDEVIETFVMHLILLAALWPWG
jgi:hypothetical protein